MLYTLGFGFSIMQRLSQRVLKYPSGGDILVYLGCYNKMPKTEWLKQQKCSFFFLQFWRLEDEDRGASRVGIW